MIIESHRAGSDLQLGGAARPKRSQPHLAVAALPPLVDVGDATKARALRRAIEFAIGSVYGIDELMLFQRTRGKASIAMARQVAMYLAHISCRLSFADVGRVFDRDRTTVSHACCVVEDRRDDEAFDRALELLEWVIPTLIEPHGAPRAGKDDPAP